MSLRTFPRSSREGSLNVGCSSLGVLPLIGFRGLLPVSSSTSTSTSLLFLSGSPLRTSNLCSSGISASSIASSSTEASGLYPLVRYLPLPSSSAITWLLSLSGRYDSSLSCVFLSRGLKCLTTSDTDILETISFCLSSVNFL